MPENKINKEAERLFSNLKYLNYSLEDCKKFASIILKINKLKKEKDAVVLAHSYQIPQIIFGVSDFNGDSFGLSKEAKKTSAKIIVFCGVHFMAETAKILSPEKKVLIPSLKAGCSLAESINAQNVKAMRKKFPNANVVCYINTSAEVKAECDACCTSANALKVVEAMPSDEVIFLPDYFMGLNLQKRSSKKIHLWSGKCVVHEKFTVEQLAEYKAQYPDLKILAHLECRPEVVDFADMSGGTTDMRKYIEQSNEKRFMLVTECGMSDFLRAKFPEKEFINPCSICPYMKEITLENVLESLEKEQFVVNVPKDVADKARNSLNKMIEIGK